MESIHKVLKEVTVGWPRTFGGLTVYSLTGISGAAPKYQVLDEAIAAGTARVTEIGEGGSVPELAFHNDGDRPVLVLDGEELAGAKQNRVVNLTLLAPAKQKIVIPVSCVEAGRWASMSEEFTSTAQVMYSRARGQKYAQVSRAMAAGAGRTSDQSRVWEDIGLKQRELCSNSPTARMTDTFEENQGRLDDYVRNLPCVEGQVGAVFALTGRLSCVELFDSAETLKTMWPKLVRSWALDALPVADQPHEVQPVADAQALLEEIANAQASKHEALGLGTDLRFEGARLNGGALIHEKKLVHLCVFRSGTSDDSGWDGWRRSRMTRASRRRGQVLA